MDPVILNTEYGEVTNNDASIASATNSIYSEALSNVPSVPVNIAGEYGEVATFEIVRNRMIPAQYVEVLSIAPKPFVGWGRPII